MTGILGVSGTILAMLDTVNKQYKMAFMDNLNWRVLPVHWTGGGHGGVPRQAVGRFLHPSLLQDDVGQEYRAKGKPSCFNKLKQGYILFKIQMVLCGEGGWRGKSKRAGEKIKEDEGKK